jgi:Xaa-Pro aminopeptidase
MVGYTIEPGIYLKNKFGVRSEIDFYINEKNRVVITTKVQREILKV